MWRAGRLDAAVIALPYDLHGLVAEPLFTDRFLLAGSRVRIAALSATDAPPRPTDVSPDALLLLDEGHCLADQALDVCGLSRARQRVDLGASSLSTLCGLVAQGFGLTFVPRDRSGHRASRQSPRWPCCVFRPLNPSG